MLMTLTAVIAVIPMYKGHCFWGYFSDNNKPCHMIYNFHCICDDFWILSKQMWTTSSLSSLSYINPLPKIGHLYLCVMQSTGWTSTQVKTYSRPIQDLLPPPSACGLFVFSAVWQHRGRRCPGESKIQYAQVIQLKCNLDTVTLEC